MPNVVLRKAIAAKTALATVAAWAATFFVMPELARAALPAPLDPKSGAPADGDFIDYFKFTANDTLIAAGLLISAVCFAIAGWSTFAKFMQARQGRAEWSEVAVVGGVAGVLLVLTSYLLNQSAGIVGGGGGDEG